MKALVVTVLLGLGSGALAVPVQFKTSDQVIVYGEFTPVEHPRGAFLLFHAFGFNRHEYDEIARRLAREGYASLAIDQRYGGTWGGQPNRTVEGLGSLSLEETEYPLDMNAAYAWMRQRLPGVRLFALGSGRGASLLFPFAQTHPDLAGLLAFSPSAGELQKLDVLRAARGLRMPVFVTSDRLGNEVQDAGAVFEAVASAKKARYVPTRYALRGAGVLDPGRMVLAPGLSEVYWQAVLRFLREL